MYFKTYMKKFTFKTEKAVGRYRSFDTDDHQIKFNKFVCGQIQDGVPYQIRLMVWTDEEKHENARWKWIALKKESNSLQEAKEFLNQRIEILFEKFNIRITEYKPNEQCCGV